MYSYRGRISRTAYALAAVSNVKPIVHITKDGQVEAVAKMLGMSRGISYMRSQLSGKEPDPDYPLCLLYTHNRDNAELLAKGLEKDGYDIPENRIVNVSATIGIPGVSGRLPVANAPIIARLYVYTAKASSSINGETAVSAKA